MLDFVTSLLGLIIRLGLLLAGLVFFASLMAAGMVLLLLWLLRALWARLTGKPVMPWVFKFNRRPPWQQQAGRGDGFGNSPASSRDDVVDVQATDVSVVTDVEPKRIEPR
ncbi:MAG: hypothetical protein FD135_5538 [Comamonadaceae bacterium]|nr:MAG: hypothetical protein FD135_5538 [Comamonadaceae bacterium]